MRRKILNFREKKEVLPHSDETREEIEEKNKIFQKILYPQKSKLFFTYLELTLFWEKNTNNIIMNNQTRTETLTQLRNLNCL